MLFPELSRQLEAARWHTDRDLPWESFETGMLSRDQALMVKMHAIDAWAQAGARDDALDDAINDGDLSAFTVLWRVEAQRHAQLLMEYLRRFRPQLVPSDDELQEVRVQRPQGNALEALMRRFCEEIRQNHWHRRAADWHTEPLISHIYTTLAHDDARHGGAWRRYLQRDLARHGDRARATFSRMAVIVLNARRTAVPPHASEMVTGFDELPGQTLKQRLTDPRWLERWLDEQIRFDARWEQKVIERTLHHVGALLGRPFPTVLALNRYRKSVAVALVGAPLQQRSSLLTLR